MKHLLITTIAAVLLVGCGPSVDIWTGAQTGNIEAVKQHLADGVDVNSKSDIGRTPLDVAIAFKQPLITDLLRKHGGKTRDELKAAESIEAAAELGNIEAVKQHLDDGTEVNARTEDGWTALHFAAQNSRREIAELLIANGADVNAVAMDDVFSGQTPLDAANKYNQGAVAVLLRKYGGKTCVELEALIDAAKKGNIEDIKQHLAAGGDVNSRNKNGDTLLNYAAYLGHKEIVELLVENGAEVNSKGLADWTPLHLAARNNKKQIVQLLIAKGAEMNPYTTSGFGGTPLDVADGKIADILRKHGGKTGEELKAEGK